MQRRQLLKAGAGTALVGGAGVLAMSGGAAAAESDFSVANASVETADGAVSRVFVTPKGGISWSNFDEPITTIEVTIESRVLNNGGGALTGFTTAYQNSWDLGSHGGVGGAFNNQELNQIDLYGEGDSGLRYFEETDDGDKLNRKVDVRFTVRLLNESGDLADPQDTALIENTARFTTTTVNKNATGSAGGSFDSGMEG